MLHRFERREEDGSRQQYLLPGVVETLTDPCTSKMCQKREGVPVPERRRDRERRSLPAANFSILDQSIPETHNQVRTMRTSSTNDTFNFEFPLPTS